MYKIISILLCMRMLFSLMPGMPQSTSSGISFPGAEGCGAQAAGGPAAVIYHVTNLNDSGQGSFRDAVSRPQRTVVFDVSGCINLKSKLDFSNNITVAGQTATGGGITLYGNTVSLNNTHDNVLRYIRIREGMPGRAKRCALYVDNADNIVIDHASVEWGRWDNLHIQNSKNVTIQYSIIGESINPQNFGCIMQDANNVTIHHCLWIDNKSRNPKGKGNFQYINNVVYNWAVCGFVGGHSGEDHNQDIINNYFIAGPDSNNRFLGECKKTDHIYQSGNFYDLNKNGILDGQKLEDRDILNAGASVRTSPYIYPESPVTSDTAQEAYEKVLQYAGDSLNRDFVDSRLVQYVRSLGTIGKIINDPSEVKNIK